MFYEEPRERVLCRLIQGGFPFVHIGGSGDDRLIEEMIREQWLVKDDYQDFQAGGFILGFRILGLGKPAHAYLFQRLEVLKKELETITETQARSFLEKFPYGHPWHDFGQVKLNAVIQEDREEELSRREKELELQVAEYRRANTIAEEANRIADKTRLLARKANLIAWIAAGVLIASTLWTVWVYFDDQNIHAEVTALSLQVKLLREKVSALEHASPLESPSLKPLEKPKGLPRSEAPSGQTESRESRANTTQLPSTPAPEKAVDK